ncbi:hypothetical protein [Macellibacteroides fermentans]|uniref:hypothetical protein n=1 Tax=Macellibacteroides fermentans TaxID=879969 RepID=UPI00406BF9F0
MSLLLCLLMIFTIFSWNVQQVHANPAVAVAGKYVAGAILTGMGVVATTPEGQAAIGEFVYDRCSVSTKDKLTAIAGMIAVGSQQAIKISQGIYDDFTAQLEGSIVGNQLNLPPGQVNLAFNVSQQQAQNMTIAQNPAGISGGIVITMAGGSVINVPGSIYPTYQPLGRLSLDYQPSNGWWTLTGTSVDGYQWFRDIARNDAAVAFTVAYTVYSTAIPLDTTFEPKDSIPPPFWLPINDMGTITLPTSQDALYEGVQGVVAEDMPFEVQESLGNIQGDVGAIKGILGGIGAILGNIFNKFLELLGSVGSIGQVLSNIWNKILEMLASMVAFFQAILDWITSFFSELALTIEAVLTEFFTLPAPFVLPTDMFDGMLDDLLDKTGLSAFDQTFSRLKNLQTGYGSPPEITINLHELMAATSHVGNGFSVPLANKESLVIDFAKLQEVEFWNMSLIELIRALLSLSMVGMTFNYIYRKIIPDKVIE